MMVCMVYFSLYINHNNTPCIMQRIATPCFNGELSLVHQGIAALCYDRTRIKMGQQQDERHEVWKRELKAIEERRGGLIERQKAIIKQSQKCGVGVMNGVII